MIWVKNYCVCLIYKEVNVFFLFINLRNNRNGVILFEYVFIERIIDG